MQNGQQSRMAKAITPTSTRLNTAMAVLSTNTPQRQGASTAGLWATSGNTASTSMAP
jgi:hypothetical protein